MNIKTTSNSHMQSGKDTLFLGFFEGETKIQLAQMPEEHAEFLRDNFKSMNFSGKKDQSIVLLLPSKVNAIVLGLGQKKAFMLNNIREAVGDSVKIANRLGAKEIAISCNMAETISPPDAATAIAESAIMAQYKFDNHKTDRTENTVETIVISDATADIKSSVQKAASYGQLLGESNIRARELANTMPKIASPEYMAEQAKRIAKENGLSIKVLSKKEMESQGMNGILAVGGGSHNEPKLVIMEYKTNASSKTIALVGKGVCFDSGGYDIKPASGMETMKMDKCGAVAVMVTMEAIAKLKPKVNVIGIMPFVENLVSSTSYKPGDIVHTMSGKTIEILNTDAEGRVILSDALHYAATRYKPEAIIDIATLTGAVQIALGNNVAGVMGNDGGLISKLIVAGSKTHERLWELPMFEDYGELIKSDFADLKNVISNNPGNPAGTITAGYFLSHFIGDAKWAHLDIAGTAWSGEDKAYICKGTTGFGVRLFCQFLMDYE